VDLFFHQSEVKEPRINELLIGDLVEFVVRNEKKGLRCRERSPVEVRGAHAAVTL